LVRSLTPSHQPQASRSLQSFPPWRIPVPPVRENVLINLKVSKCALKKIKAIAA
jgi:hypothetical protein